MAALSASWGVDAARLAQDQRGTAAMIASLSLRSSAERGGGDGASRFVDASPAWGGGGASSDARTKTIKQIVRDAKRLPHEVRAPAARGVLATSLPYAISAFSTPRTLTPPSLRYYV